MNSLIEVKNLSRKFGDFIAVDDVSFDVFPGDVYGFLGPNGAGKSTTIRMLLSLIRPDSGTIRVFGKDLSVHRREIMSRIGCIVEKPDFYKYLSARDNLNVLARYNGISMSAKRSDELFELVGLTGRGDDSVKTYSHGMKQRLGLAQALLHDPDIIILDEPTTGLDPQGIIDIRNLILFLSKEKGKTIFLSSHILNELELVASRMAILNRGRLVLEGELKALLNDARRVVELQVDMPEPALELIGQSAFSGFDFSIKGDSLRAEMDKSDIPALVTFLSSSGIKIYSVESRRQLEEMFLKLTESAERMKITDQIA